MMGRFILGRRLFLRWGNGEAVSRLAQFLLVEDAYFRHPLKLLGKRISDRSILCGRFYMCFSVLERFEVFN